MNVRVTYPKGRIDVFDTSAYVASSPFGQDGMLSNFELRLADIEEDGLWLVANYYAAKPEYRDGEAGIPVARRAKGWRFLLATKDEAARLTDVTVDGEVVIARIAGKLCNMREFETAALQRIGASNDGTLERIAKLHAYLSIESGTEDPSVPGMPKEAVDYALKAIKEQPSRNGKRVVSEDWGDMDEADW